MPLLWLLWLNCNAWKQTKPLFISNKLNQCTPSGTKPPRLAMNSTAAYISKGLSYPPPLYQPAQHLLYPRSLHRLPISKSTSLPGPLTRPTSSGPRGSASATMTLPWKPSLIRTPGPRLTPSPMPLPLPPTRPGPMCRFERRVGVSISIN